jgi:hypothetical protein
VRDVCVHRHFVARQIAIHEEAVALVHGELPHQCRWIELDRRRGERAGKIADRGLGRAADDTLRGDRRLLGLREIEAAVHFVVGHADQGGCRARLLERLGDDERNRLVVVLNIRSTQQPRGVAIGFPERPRVRSRDQCEEARRRARFAIVDRDDPAVRDAGADDIAVSRVPDGVMTLVGRSVPFPWSSTDHRCDRWAIVRASSASATAFAPRGSSLSAASTRHGLCATPASATRPVTLHNRADRDEREGVRRPIAHLVIDVRAAGRFRQGDGRDQFPPAPRWAGILRTAGWSIADVRELLVTGDQSGGGDLL